MDVRVYSLGELKNHMLAKHADGKQVSPLSPLRLQSYLHNPRARAEDPVLFELWIKDTLVAYRTLLPDSYTDSHGNPRPFAWLSGNWVHPAQRRKGYSTKLLGAAEDHWEGRLMYTNYAPASKAVYDRTGKFPLLAERKGKRFYLRAAAEALLVDRLGNRSLLKFGDQLVNRVREKKLQQFRPVDPEDCLIEEVSTLEEELLPQIFPWQRESLFRRDGDIFRWILEYPWITEDTSHPLNYPFSYQSERFENILLRFTLPDQQRGVLWLLLHNQALSVPYVFAQDALLYAPMARTIIHYMITRKCAYTTIRHKTLAKQLTVHKKLFLGIRDLPQLIFAHTAIHAQVPRDRLIQDGDGDVVFTG